VAESLAIKSCDSSGLSGVSTAGHDFEPGSPLQPKPLDAGILNVSVCDMVDWSIIVAVIVTVLVESVGL
jgi:hypothetical protein